VSGVKTIDTHPEQRPDRNPPAPYAVTAQALANLYIGEEQEIVARVGQNGVRQSQPCHTVLERSWDSGA
jgi:hypothetical protein